MKHLTILLICTIMILAMAPCAAAADGRFYLGVSIGSASLNEDFDGFDVDADSTALRFVAGWQFNEYFSLEGGYQNFGDFEQSFETGGETVAVSLKADGFTLGVTGMIPLGERFALFGRFGSFFWDGDASINNVTQAKPEDSNLYLGLGAQYAVSDRFSIVADWSWFDLADSRSNVASLGLIVGF